MKKNILVIIAILIVAACGKNSGSPAAPTVSAPTVSAPTGTVPTPCRDPHLQGIMTWTPASMDDSGSPVTVTDYMVLCSSATSSFEVDAGLDLSINLAQIITADGSWSCQEKAVVKDSSGNMTKDGDWSNAISIQKNGCCFYQN